MGLRTGKEYNVCLQGTSLDVGNQGCCALAASFIKLVIDTKPNVRIYFLYANRTNGIQRLEVSGRKIEVSIVNCRLSPRAKLSEHLFWILLLAFIQKVMPIKTIRHKIIQSNRWLRTLDAADFVGEIQGGDSFSDIYGLCRFILKIIPSVIAILMQKNLVLLPQTFGPFKSTVAKHVARSVMRHASQLFSRDQDSIELVRNTLGKKGKYKSVRFCPDIAFVLESILPNKPDIQPKLGQKSDIPLIGFNISTLLYVGGFTRKNMFGLKVDYKQFVHILLKELMEHTKAHVLLVPHEYFPFMIDGKEYTEIEICKEINQSMDEQYNERTHIVMQEYNQSQIKGIIGNCDFFIGSRMHACIAALSQGIPTVGLAYSKKFRGVFGSVGMEQCVVDMREKDQEETLDTIVKAFEQRDSIAEDLKTTITEAQKLVWDTFEGMLL